MSGNLFRQVLLTVKPLTAFLELLYPKGNRYFSLLFICIFVFNYLFIYSFFFFLSRTCGPECLNETQRLTLVTKSIVNRKLLLQFVDGASVVALFTSKQNCYSGLVYILHIYI